MALTNFLKVNKTLAIASYKIQRNIKGLDCTIRKPYATKTIYGIEDSLIEYEDSCTTGKYLIYNLFQEGLIGCEDFDAFILNPYILTLWDEQLELKSKVEVDFGGRVFNFVIDDRKSPTPHVKEQLFVAHILVPAT